MRGFTLLEVMIVVVLIGIISTMTVLKMGNGGESQWQQQEAQRLLELFKLSSQEAMVTGNPLGLELSRDGYRFLQLHGEHWLPELRDALFRQRTLQPKLSLALRLNNRPVTLTAQAHPAPLAKPHIVFTPDGDISIFDIIISIEGNSEQLSFANTLKEGLSIRTLTARQPL